MSMQHSYKIHERMRELRVNVAAGAVSGCGGTPPDRSFGIDPRSIIGTVIRGTEVGS